MHGAVAFVRHERREVANVAPETRQLERRRVFVAIARPDGTVNSVEAVGERKLARDNAVQRVRALDAAAEADGLEEGLGRRAERRDVCSIPAVSCADALERVAPQRVAQREVEARGCLVVVLHQRLLGGAQVCRYAGVGFVVLGGVEVRLVVEYLEADVKRPIAEIWLSEPKGKLPADVAEVALDAERLAQTE